MMNSNSLKIYLCFTASAILFLVGCEYDETECSVIEVSYSSDIQPMIDAKCSSCHSGPTPESGLDLTDHQQVSDSLTCIDILQVVSLELGDDNIMPPSPNPPLTDCQVDLFQNWVDQGRLNN